MQSSNFYPPPSSSQNYHLLGQQPDDRFKYTSGPSVMQPSSSTPTPDILTTSNSQATSLGPQDLEDEDELVDEDSGDTAKKPGKRSGRRKIKIEYINDKTRRHITFSKRKAGIMKKAYELSTLTGTQVLLLVVSETGLVYTFTTPKLQPLVTKPEGKNLIQTCLNAPDSSNEQQEGSYME